MKANETPQQYINKSDLVAEIERMQKTLNLDDIGGRSVMAWSEGFKNFLNTLEVKEVDLNKELESYFKGFGKFASVGIDDCIDIAKHFFELGLKTQHSSINIPNIDDIFEENGIDPNSKDTKIFKECYYMALEKLKAQKGE